MAKKSAGFGGVYNATPLSLQDGDGANPALDSEGKLILSSESAAGGVYNATLPTYTDGQTVEAQYDANGRAIVTLGTAISKTVDSIEARPEGTTFTNITASVLVRTGSGILVGMYVNSTTAGTIKFWDSLTAANTVINNTITPAVGYHPLGNAEFSTGLFATIASTLDVTLYYIPTP